MKGCSLFLLSGSASSGSESDDALLDSSEAAVEVPEGSKGVAVEMHQLFCSGKREGE